MWRTDKALGRGVIHEEEQERFSSERGMHYCLDIKKKKKRCIIRMFKKERKQPLQQI